MIVSKLLQARKLSLSTFSMLAMWFKLTIELQDQHRLGVKPVVPANNGGPDLQNQRHVG